MEGSEYKIVQMVSVLNMGGVSSAHDCHWGLTIEAARSKLAEMARDAPRKVKWIMPERHFAMWLSQSTRYDHFIVPDRLGDNRSAT